MGVVQALDEQDGTNGEELHLASMKKVPKVELHAHLNGCVRETTLFELAKERGVTLNEHHFSEQPIAGVDHSMYNVRPRSLQDCFEMFAEITKCVDDLAALSRIAMEALEDFAEHHVAYLELRSTPKNLLFKSGGSEQADKRSYCKTILECMQSFEKKEITRFESESAADSHTLPRLPMVCRFIVAIDRSQPINDAYEHVDLAESLKSEFGDFVVGVDLGGNPTKVGCQ
jgi:adenosine deaminase